VPHQRAELSPADAERLGVADGDAVEVAYDGALVRARATVRAAIPTGTVFLEVATPAESANALTNGEPRLVEVRHAPVAAPGGQAPVASRGGQV
jgi:anaerobic selenocysteine-containing dehydrogenase